MAHDSRGEVMRIRRLHSEEDIVMLALKTEKEFISCR